VAAQVVLHLVFVMPLEETVGIAAVARPFKFAEQGRVKGAAGDGVVDGAAIDLRCARDVVGRLGTTFDLQRIDADSTRRCTCSMARKSFEFMM